MAANVLDISAVWCFNLLHGVKCNRLLLTANHVRARNGLRLEAECHRQCLFFGVASKWKWWISMWKKCVSWYLFRSQCAFWIHISYWRWTHFASHLELEFEMTRWCIWNVCAPKTLVPSTEWMSKKNVYNAMQKNNNRTKPCSYTTLDCNRRTLTIPNVILC